MSGELCGESLPELVPALLFALVVWAYTARMLSGASTVSMVNRRNLPSMQVRSVMAGVRCGAVIRETPVTG